MKCKICNKRFKLIKENNYIVTVHPTGLNCLIEPIKTYEAFDCPKCGCQNIVNRREESNILVKECEENEP